MSIVTLSKKVMTCSVLALSLIFIGCGAVNNPVTSNLVSEISGYKTYYKDGEWWVYDSADNLYSYQKLINSKDRGTIENICSQLENFNSETAKYYVIRDSDNSYAETDGLTEYDNISLSYIIPKSNLSETYTVFCEWTQDDWYYSYAIYAKDVNIYRKSKGENILFKSIFTLA